jgi:hypothetical protein
MLAGSENAFEPSAPALQREAYDEFTKMVRDSPHLERLISRSMAMLLKIEGNCSRLRAKPAHMMGHLPTASTDLGVNI